MNEILPADDAIPPTEIDLLLLIKDSLQSHLPSADIEIVEPSTAAASPLEADQAESQDS